MEDAGESTDEFTSDTTAEEMKLSYLKQIRDSLKTIKKLLKQFLIIFVLVSILLLIILL